MKQTVLTILLFIFWFSALFSQTGSIQGAVIDQTTGEPLIGAIVKIIGADKGSVTDLDGFFSIERVPIGIYTVEFSYVSFKTGTLADIRVNHGQITQIKMNMDSETNSIQEVVITADKVRNNEVSILSEIKTYMQVVSGISEQQIKRSLDGNAAQIVRRVPGITIVGERFINIRGLNSRYNNVMLHNALTPSMETDVKSFSFDIIPAGQIERLLVFKSPSSDLPGDFAGGVVKIFTKGIPDKTGFTLDYSSSFRQGTTFNEFYQPKQGKLQWTAFNDGYHNLPDKFPSSINNVINNPIELELAGKALKNNWVAAATQAAPDQRINLTQSIRFKAGKAQIGHVTSLAYHNSKTLFNINRGDYNEQTGGQESRIYNYNDAQYNTNIRLGVLHNWTARMSNHHQIEWKNLFNQNSNGSYVNRGGKNFESNYIPNSHSFDQVYRNILSSQLLGNHTLDQKESWLFDWTLGYNRATRNQPDYRRYRSDLDESTGLSTLYVPFGAAQAFFLGRFSADMSENTYSGNLNLSKKINDVIVKLGGNLEDKRREFTARNLGYVRGSASDFDNTLIESGIDNLFNHISNRSGIKIDEQTNPSDSYVSTNNLYAGFVNVLAPLGNKILFNGGVRFEYNQQTLTSALIGGDPIYLDYPIMKTLPSASLVYTFNHKTILKASYGITLNRPEFRELAPFAYYDFDYNYVYKGAPLKTAVVQNLDTRIEFYPTPNEVLSVAVFYKKFKNPIESLVVPGSGSGGAKTFTFANAEQSINYGMEIEIKKSFSTLTTSTFLGKLSTVFNATFIHSNVTLGKNIQSGQSDQRALQGQSPFIVNGGLNYNDMEIGFQVNALYNVIGKRIFAVGFDGYPDLYEMPRNVLDLTFTKEIRTRLILKGGITDILNQPARILQDGNQDNKWQPSKDQVIQQYAPGRVVQIGFSYKLY